MASSCTPDGSQELSEAMMTEPATQELVNGVLEGDEALVKSALAKGASPEVTVSNTAGSSWCLVCSAASHGHDHLLPHLLQAGLNIEGGDTNDQTPLMVAAMKGNTKTVKALLCLGANPLATDKLGRTALHIAAGWGWQDCVAALLPVTPATAAHLEGLTPVHVASYGGHVQVLEQLAGAGWHLTVRHTNGSTPLHYAAIAGQVSAVRWLVRRGGDPCVQDKGGNTPLDMAVHCGRHEVETWLIKNGGGGVTVASEDPRMSVNAVRAYRRQYEDNHNRVLSWLLEGNEAAMDTIPKVCDGHAVSRDGLTPLHAAALRGAPSSVVEALLARGVSPHVFTPDNQTPADLALREDHRPVIQALHTHQCPQDDAPPDQLYEELLSTISRGDHVQEVSRLLCRGAPLESRGGRFALKLAVTNDRARTVNLLLASGASLSASLLQEAWHSPNVTPAVLASLTTTYCCRLRAEQRRLVQVSGVIVEGISNLLEDIEGDTPWRTTWRGGKHTDRAALSDLLAKTAAANCPLTASFLHSAGAWPFFSPASGGSALHAALDAGHQGMAELLVRDLGACPYMPDSSGRLPLHIMTDKEKQKLEQRLFEEELEKLRDLELRQKADRGKATARTALAVQRVLFNLHKRCDVETVSADDGRACLLLAVRKGLLQLTYLLLRVGRCPVDDVLDKACGTTALHEAASHGEDGCVALLVSAGAKLQQRDTYGQTPRHLAAMFGHTSTFDLLARQVVQDPPCRAGTTATEVMRGFEAYLQLYEKYDGEPLTPSERRNPDSVTRKLMKQIEVGKLQQEAQRVAVDLSRGEALEIREVVMAELKAIMDKVSATYPTYHGDVTLVGSSRDGSKLYAPDEFDVNIVVHEDGVGVNVIERREEEALLKGRLEISVETNNPHLQGINFMASLFEEVHRCLTSHTLLDKRLSLVPPGLTSTQVGVALALAWQGQEYPLLLVGVDLVPVLEVPWLEQIPRPFLTPADATTIQLSNAADATWRCSFALTEAKVLETLRPAERQAQVMGKVILSRLKAERWMPRHKKSFCIWFDTREWNIPVPSGFCFKNAFLRWLEHKRCEEKDPVRQLGTGGKENLARQVGEGGKEDPTRELEAGREEDPARWVVEVFRLMCANPEESREHLATLNSPAYFGGDCEGRKPGDGAPIVVQCLEENLENLWSGLADQLSQDSQEAMRNIMLGLDLWIQMMQLQGDDQQ